MKQTTLTQRLLSALVALCMVLSVCAPALAADDRVIWIQKSGGTVQLLNASTIGTKLPGCSYAYDGTTVTITMAASKEQADGMADVTLAGGPSTDIVLVCTNDTRMDDGRGLTITGMRNVTIRTEDTSKEYTGAFYGALKVTDCYGNVTVTNPRGAAVVYSLDVDNTAGTGNVTITGSNAKGSICAVAGAFGTNAKIASNGDVKIENIVSIGAAQLNYQAVDGELTVTSSKSVTTTGGASKVDITSTGAVEIKSDDTKNVVGKGLSVNAGGAVTVTGGGTGDAAAAIKGDANITAGGSVNVSNFVGIAVDGSLTVNSCTGVTVVGNTQHNAVRYAANITSSGAVNISNSRGIAVGGKLTVNNASGKGDVTVSGKGGNTVGRGAEITSKGAVNITNTDNTGLAVSGDLTVHDSNSVKVSGGTASSPAVSGNITLTSTGKMELRNPNGQVTSNKLTVKNSTGEVIVTGNKSGSTALVRCGASIDTTGAVTITNSSGPAIFGGLNVERSGGITVTGRQASEPIITGNSTIKDTNKVEIINKDTLGLTAQNITYTPPEGKGYFYQTTQNGSKLHTRSAISSTTPYLCIEPDTLYTLTLPEGVTAKTNGISDTSFYAGESVTVTAPQDTETNKFKQWNFSGKTPSDLSGHWETKNPLTFTMPEGNVTLTADYMQLYNLTVTGGTIVNGTNTGNYLPGTEVTVAFTGSTGIEDQFEKWTGGENIIKADPADWQSKPSFSFTMPAGNVTLKAECKTVYNVSVADSRGTVLVNNEERSRALEGETVTVKASDTFFNAYHQFNGWSLSDDSAQMVNPSEGWKTSKEFTFKMPAGDVSLTADYKQLYDLTVTGGTIVDGNGDTGIYLPGTEVTVVFDDSHDIAKQFKQWKSTDTEPEAPTAGWPEGGWQTSKTFTFKMPVGDVTLEAEYKTVYNVSVDENRGTVLVNDEKRTRALEGETVTVKASDTFFNAYHQFNGWSLSDDSAQMVEPSENWQTSKEFTFKMPAGNVTLKADYKQLYDLTVNGGTIVDENGDTGETTGIYLPGTEVTIQFTDSDDITKQFKQWTYTGTAPEEPDGGWQNSKKFTFKMPAGDVSLRAEYRETYRIFETAGKAEFFAEGAEEQNIYEALPGTRIIAKVLDSELNDHRQFNMWRLGDISMELVNPEDGWQNKPSFSFAMPEGDVELQAYFTTLYDVNVTHGTIVDGTGDTGTSQKIVKPGQLVTVRAESTEENPFLQWTYTGKEPVEPDDGWQTSPEFTFKMPNGNVTLDAQRDQLYKVSINDSLGSVTINGEPRSSLWVKEGETVTVATTLKDGYWMEFMKWTAQDGSAAPVEPSDNWQTSTTFTFKMPNGPVELVAQWSASSLDPYQPIDPDEPLDEDFGVEPDTTGGTIAAVAVGGAAIWGGYEIATRVILHNLLPEGAAIPANRGQLALLVWNTAGRPEPAGAPAFADVTDPDMAKAAQWCTEQGTMGAKGDRFEPEGWTPKFKVIEVWNKAFPAA